MDPYEILGVSRLATDEEIKRAYRTLSKKYHPDANIDNPHQEEYTEKFKAVQNAYQTIMKARKNGYGPQSQTYTQTDFHNDQAMMYREIQGFVQAGRYQDAMAILDQIRNRQAVWFYFSALCQNGLGNRVTALEHAKIAVQMEPYNMNYLLLLQRLQQVSGQYRQTARQYESPQGSQVNCCYQLLLCNFLFNCCCFC